MDVTSDPRFAEAVEQAVIAMPDDLRAEMDRLVQINDEDVAARVAQIAAAHEETRARYGPQARTAPPATSEHARKSLAFQRVNDLDWLFFRRWRLAEGWLAPEEAKRALGIFHDRLAIAMRRAVTARLHPHAAFVADR
jgi:hypothetical protein